MGSLSIWHWLIVIAGRRAPVRGRGKISDLMGDVAKGVKSFKKGLADDDEAPKPIENKADRTRRPRSAERSCRMACRRPRRRRGGRERRSTCSKSAGPNFW